MATADVVLLQDVATATPTIIRIRGLMVLSLSFRDTGLAGRRSPLTIETSREYPGAREIPPGGRTILLAGLNLKRGQLKNNLTKC